MYIFREQLCHLPQSLFYAWKGIPLGDSGFIISICMDFFSSIIPFITTVFYFFSNFLGKFWEVRMNKILLEIRCP